MANEIVEFQNAELASVDDTGGAMTEAVLQRQITEVQASMAIARRFPRNHARAYANIMDACKRPTLANKAIYSYPRGGSRVSGPSIRLAEAIAQAWGNIDCGVTEIEQRFGESTMMAYAWDLETNTRVTKTFQVKHSRDTRNGSYKLTDSRDIYELNANMGARRLRACILAVIPGDVVEAAVDACRQTLAKSDGGMPLKDRIAKMTAEFQAIGVTADMLETKLGHSLESMNVDEFPTFVGIYNSLRDRASKIADHFAVEKTKAATLDELADKEETKRSKKGHKK